MDENWNAPKEISEFLRARGNALLIKGDAGTGKTIFGLEAIGRLENPDDGLYVSTRVSELRLSHQFPWLTDEWQSRMIDFTYATTARELTGNITTFFEKPVPNKESEFKAIGKRAEKKKMIVVDSIDGMAEKLNTIPRALLIDLERDFVEKHGASLLVTSEGGEGNLDYLVDGIVVLRKDLIGGRLLRTITVDKLRGVWIRHAKHLFSLAGGRFTFANIFPIWALRQLFPEKPKHWVPMTTHPETVSSGSPDLDKMLNGGFAPGTYSLFILGENVPNEVVHLIQFPFALDTLAKGRGLFMLPTSGITAEQVVRIIEPYISKDKIEKFGRFVSEERIGQRSQDENYLTIIPSNPSMSRDFALICKAIRELHENTGKPISRILGMDYLDARYAENPAQLFRMNANMVALTHTYGDIQLSFARENAPGIKGLQPITDAVFKLETFDGTITMYGIKPSTPIYAVTPDYTRGIARINLQLIA